MDIRGQYRIWVPGQDEIILPNSIVLEGRDEFLNCLFNYQALTFYVGLCNQVPDNADVLTDITTEPGATGGYARQALTQDAVGWPTIDTVSGVPHAASKVLTYTASGADFDAVFSRAFLCSVASGAGKLYGYSGALSVPITLLDGTSFQMQYEVFLN